MRERVKLLNAITINLYRSGRFARCNDLMITLSHQYPQWSRSLSSPVTRKIRVTRRSRKSRSKDTATYPSNRGGLYVYTILHQLFNRAQISLHHDSKIRACLEHPRNKYIRHKVKIDYTQNGRASSIGLAVMVVPAGSCHIGALRLHDTAHDDVDVGG